MMREREDIYQEAVRDGMGLRPKEDNTKIDRSSSTTTTNNYRNGTWGTVIAAAAVSAAAWAVASMMNHGASNSPPAAPPLQKQQEQKIDPEPPIENSLPARVFKARLFRKENPDAEENEESRNSVHHLVGRRSS